MKKLQSPSTGFYDISERDNGELIVRLKGMLIIKWRANPGDLVTYFLARDLRGTGLFNGVFILSSKHPASHIIDGTLDQFYQESIDNSWQAVLSVNITFMLDYEPDISKRILFQKEYTSKKQCEQKNPKALAEAMSQAMAEISKTIIKDIHHSLTKRR